MKVLRLVSGAVALSLGVMTLAIPAYADTPDEPDSDEVVSGFDDLSPDVGEEFELDTDGMPNHSALQEEFTSLAGALLSMQASQAGMTLDSYLKANDLKVAKAGRGGSQLVKGSLKGQEAVELKGTTAQELSRELAAAGFGLDTRNYSSLSDMASDVLAKAHTADGAVTVAGAAWVADLKNLRPGKLTKPSVGGAQMPSIPQDALPFGLLLDKSIAGTVLEAPDLFAQVSKSGVGSTELGKVFSKQMLDAWEVNGKSLTDALPSKCTGLMMEMMATGDSKRAAKYDGCQPACVTGGMYLNAQSNRLFTSGTEQIKPNLTDDFWSHETLLQAQDWRVADLMEQNPDLVQSMLSKGTGGSAAALCADASRSSKTALQDTLPGIFGQLRK